ncbi:MAG: DNA polymerase IV [Proteobacteria bacterium]|nr:DNA polymerase IV [Pseudomonadota bacterium]
MPGLCRDCGDVAPPSRLGRCAACGSPRRMHHPELHELAIAHIDCDAFYAAVEKRDRPELVDQPVVVGGATRGVVAACCYIARSYGIHSAMPMFKAMRLCPHAVVVPPDMTKYSTVGRQVRELMRVATPLVEPISIDEAFLDLTNTERAHHASPAVTLSRLARRIQEELGITVSIGLSYNKFLAKVASDLDKPRGFAVIGRAEATTFLAPKPVSLIWGVGAALKAKLAQRGIATIGDLQQLDEATLVRHYGVIGRRLASFAHGEDERTVEPVRPMKSISAETTFGSDLTGLADLERELWPLAEAVSRRLKRAERAATVVTLKLKTARFEILTRRVTLPAPTQLADQLWRTARHLLARETDGTAYRLIGVGGEGLVTALDADPGDLFDPARGAPAKVERVIDDLRERLGPDAITKGRSFGAEKRVAATRRLIDVDDADDD